MPCVGCRSGVISSVRVALGLTRLRVRRVRCHGSAKAAGMRTAFVDRRGRLFGNGTYSPDAVVADFAELATVLGAFRR